ncbi:MAG: hypothetical protein QXR54_00435 [Nanopusillaceae archaeon]
MPKERVVDGLTFSYSGIINFVDLYKSLKNFWEEKGYDFIEKKHEERIFEDGTKSIKYEWYCEKKVTDYAKYIFEWTISIEKLRLIKKEGITHEYAENLLLKINGDLELDYDKYFGDKPFGIFLRALFERYLVGDEIRTHKKNISSIANNFLDLLKTLTGSYKT